MATKETTKILLVKRNMTVTKLADEMTKMTGKKYTRQNLSNRINQSYLRYDEMEAIVKILGYKIVFEDMND